MASFVFLDLETSGLDANNEITEIALVSVHRKAMANAMATGKFQPRVVDKLVLCIDPGEEVAATAQDISGLQRDMLQSSGKTVFDKEIGQQILLFLQRQEQPICLVAHNGERYDFPLLARNLANVGAMLPPDLTVRCGDSLQAFRELQPGKVSRGAYTLVNLYRQDFGPPLTEQHSAEGDALMLMKVVIKAGYSMKSWLDRYAMKSLSEYRGIEVGR